MKESFVDDVRAIVANDQATKVAEPGEGTFHLPATPIATQGPTVLSTRLAAIPAVRCDQLDSSCRQPLAQRIAQAMRGIDGVDVPVGTLDITLYRDDLSKVASHAVLQSSDISFGVDNMNLVLVDDVLYTGRTIRAAMNGLFDLGRPKRVSLCVLIDRGHREIPVEATFVGRNVQTTSNEVIEVKLTEIDDAEKVLMMEK